MNSPLLPIIKEVLIVLVGLYFFLVLKDKFKEGMPLWTAAKSRIIQFIVSPLFLPVIGIIVMVIIYYIVYTLFFN